MTAVVHVITGLGTGGAETVLSRLMRALDQEEFPSSVISLTERGDLAERIESSGVPVATLSMSRAFPSPGSFVALRSAIRESNADVVQTWMYHSDLLGGLAARSLGQRRIVWNLRQSNLSREANRLTTLLTMWTCARLSGSLPARIVCGSEAARRSHLAIGYAGAAMTMIPNGFDADEYRPDEDRRAAVRKELGVSNDAILVGLVARFDPQKDHRTFVRAAALVGRDFPEAGFLLCGERVDEANEELVGWIGETGIAGRFHLLGRRGDIPAVHAALDVAVSSSIGEGFPNAIGEAMTAGVPCVVTDVGDSRYLVGPTGTVVPAGDPEALACAIRSLLEDRSTREALGRSARARIIAEFSIGAVVERWCALWNEVASCAA